MAEFAIHSADSVDSVWVKLAHSQEIQGWIGEQEMMQAFIAYGQYLTIHLLVQ